ncbi:MAG: YifB family Mg chelatase-like AAA ATPase [Clostridia bacterium]|nr:YifB family Mg chelatase-like AAA ATPase [Clostridia bacterium]
MLSTALSCALSGVDGVLVHVETDITGGKFALSIVGLPDATVRESQDRVLPAMRNSGYMFPSSRITVNLAPADIKKEGSAFDLPIALSILAASRQIPPRALENILLFGELSLDGQLNGIRGALPLVLSAKAQGVTEILLPADNAREVAAVEGVRIYPAHSLSEAAQHLTGEKPILCQEQISFDDIRRQRPTAAYDLRDVKGQTGARRALEIAAAGGHNMLMVGVPGSGKTMLARCLPGILPEMTAQEAFDVTRIHSVAGLLPPNSGLITQRPFRTPHHSASMPALIGGGPDARPGEISLAHNGVLFLDELPEYPRPVLEALRQPLEDGFVTVSRVRARSQYQARCMLIASMNPCPCGYYGSRVRTCRCTEHEIRRYLERISGPLLDRIDLQVETDAVPVSEIRQTGASESSDAVRARVQAARERQIRRLSAAGITCNAQATGSVVHELFPLPSDSAQVLEKAVDKLHLSMRAYTRIIKVAQTIADLEQSPVIAPTHILEAVQYRTIDQKYWQN